jgi:hypothetical protein
MIIAGLLMASTICQAQTLAESERTSHNAFAPVPKELTLSGKPYMAVVEYNYDADKSAMGIYSSFGPDGALLKFDVPNILSSDTYYEKVTGYTEKVVIKDKFYDYMGDKTSYRDSSFQVIEEGIRNAYGYPDWFRITEFIDADGDTAYYGNDYRRYGGDSTKCFYEYEKYGKLYPNEYFALDTAGLLRHCHFFHYEIEYDFTNATWTKDLDYTKSRRNDYHEYVCRIQGLRFQNLDESFFPNSVVAVSQNIFNKDSDWEYILMDVENYKQYDTPLGYADGIVRRLVNQSPVYKKYIIMSSNGKQLLSIPVPDKADEYTVSAEIELVSVMNGIIYLYTHEVVRHDSPDSHTYDNCETMYVIAPATTGVESISRHVINRMNIDATAVNQGNSLGIYVAEPSDGDNIVISSMAGQVINQTPLRNAEHISIETSAYPKGVYNVTLQGSSATENQRVLIK